MYKLGCKAAMKSRGDNTLEGAYSFVALLEGISSFSRYFFDTLTNMVGWLENFIVAT